MTSRILLTTLLLSLFSAQLLAEADGPDFYRVKDVATDDVLNIRKGPSSKAPIIGTIPPGADCLRNLGCEGGPTFEEFTQGKKGSKPRWCRVEYKGTKGWVSGRYLAEGSCREAAGRTPPVHIEGYVIDPGSERPGGDYYKDFATDVKECAAWCSREPRCKGFDYHLDLEACWVKEKINPMKPNPNVVTGVKK